MAVYDWFLKSLLVTRNSIPVQPLWGVTIDYPSPGELDINPYEGRNWNVDKAAAKLMGSNYTFVNALIFAQGVKIPGEGMNVTRTGPENTGILRGLIGEGRRDLENLSISFLETNMSFTDAVLRPWAVAVAHTSLKNGDLKKKITVTHYRKTPGSQFPKTPRAIFNFYNACPVNINGEDYDYSQNKITIRQVEFAFESYDVIIPAINNANKSGKRKPSGGNTQTIGGAVNTPGGGVISPAVSVPGFAGTPRQTSR